MNKLINCEACGKKRANQEGSTCPHCGFCLPIHEPFFRPGALWILIPFGLLIVFLMIMEHFDKL